MVNINNNKHFKNFFKRNIEYFIIYYRSVNIYQDLTRVLLYIKYKFNDYVIRVNKLFNNLIN